MQAGTKALLLSVVVLAALAAIALLATGGGSDGALPARDEAGPAAAGEPATGDAMRAAAGAERDPRAREPGAPRPAGRTELASGAATAPRIALTGRLVRAGAEPLPAVEIRYTASSVLGLPVDGEAGVVQRTDAAGRFRFAVEAGRAGHLTLPGDDWVFAGRPHPRLPVPATARDHDLGDVAMAPAALLSGVVRDRQGRTLEGVQVGLSLASGVRGLEVLAPHRARTDAAGRFALAGLPGAAYRLTTASPHHLPASLEVEVAEGARRSDLVVTLEEGASVWGRVVDDRGQAVEGARVGAYRTRVVGEAMTVSGLEQGETVRTDPRGEFRLGGLEADAVTVRARADGHRDATAADVRKGTADLVLVLARNAALEGRLVDTQGQAIAGSEVRAVPAARAGLPGLRERGSATTGADGSFRLGDVAPGEVAVEARGDGHVPASAVLTLQPGETRSGVQLVAARGAALEATVVAPDGEPVEGATVAVTEGLPAAGATAAAPGFRSRRVERRVEAGHEDVVFDDGSPRVLAEGRTDADGRVRLGGLPAGAVTVQATHGELAPSRASAVTLPGSGVAHARLELRLGGAVELSVVDADRVPLPGASVVVAGPQGAPEDAGLHTAKSDARGQARLGPLPAGSYTAVLRLPPRPMQIGGAMIVVSSGGTELEDSRVSFAVRPGATTRAVLVHPVLATLSGSLSDAAGPVSGGSIELRSEAENQIRLPGASAHSTRTDQAGRFRFEDLPPGKYALVYGRAGQTVPAEEALELRGERVVERHLLLAGGVVQVTVRDGDGEPLRRAQVTFHREGAQTRRPQMIAMVRIERDGDDGGEQSMELGGQSPVVYTDVDGVARVEDVPPGKYRVAFEHPRHVGQSVEAEVARETVRDLGTVQLAFGGALRGSVVGEDGQPPMVASVEIQQVGQPEWRPTTAMRGSFRFTGLAPGRYLARARGMAPGEPPPWGPVQEIEVLAGRSSSVTLRVD